MDKRTEKARELWESRAKRYDTGARIEPAGIRNTRRLLCAGARGRTLEVAVGTGMNLEHYPPQVKLTGVDLSPAMLERARERAEKQGRPVTLVEGDAQELDFPDQSFDTVLCALALCTIPDQARALAEMHRVLVPGGRLLLVHYEPVLGPDGRPQVAMEIIQIAADLGNPVTEMQLARSDLYLADEIFLTGTAAEVTPIREVDGRTIGPGKVGPVTARLQEAFFNVVMYSTTSTRSCSVIVFCRSAGMSETGLLVSSSKSRLAIT